MDKFFLVFIICMSVSFLIGAFVSASFNPADWSIAARVITAILGTFLSAIIAAATVDETY